MTWWFAQHLGLDRLSVDTIKGDPRELRQKLMICLPRGYFGSKDAIDSWIEATVAFCRERCAFLLELAEAERRFLDGVLDRGEIDADLLDVSPEIRARIAVMPMLAWKCKNVREYKRLRS